METKTVNHNANRNLVVTENNTKQVITSNLRTNNNNNNRNHTNNNNITYVNVNKTNNNQADERKLNIEMRTQNNYNPTGNRQTERTKNPNKNYNSVRNENKELIDRLYDEIFKNESDQSLIAVNKFTYNVQNNVKMDDLIKEINDENMTKEKKKELYFRLKAGNNNKKSQVFFK